MAKKQKKKRLNRKKLYLVVGFSVFLIVGFVTWLLISALSADATLNLNSTFELPEFSVIDNLPELTGKYAAAVDGSVISSNSDRNEVVPTASTAKMILGLAIMREKPFSVGEKGETITINDEMLARYSWYLSHNGSNTRVVLGEEISEYDALVSVFLASSNNMADSLAIWAFGSLEDYREYANKMLAEYGLTDTTIGVDASGFDASTTSTPSDLARIGHLVLENDVLKQIVGTKEYEVPVAGLLTNTNNNLGVNRVIGIKTGYIGDISGYCLISGYEEGDHIITSALMNAPTREQSFDESMALTTTLQEDIKEQNVIRAGQTVGYYDSWWTGLVKIVADEDLSVLGWNEAEKQIELVMSKDDITHGSLKITIDGHEYELSIKAEEFNPEPSFGERIMHVFGWEKEGTLLEEKNEEPEPVIENTETETEEVVEEKSEPDDIKPITNLSSDNCTIRYGYLMLINPNFIVDTNFIDARRGELVSVSSLYGIIEGNAYNGDNLLDAEAAKHLSEMVKAYEAEYPGHTFETRSCYRARGTTCGRLCAATGTSDHHTGLTCDLLDPAYGTSLDTSTYDQHVDWQWLYANSYKYGFIDRFPEEWAGGSMSEPLNVDENGSTGLFETWHYRYVGVGPATEIATGKYNNGKYDSLEHYLKARGLVTDLKNGKCN